jgi:fructosamine-3-kinase
VILPENIRAAFHDLLHADLQPGNAHPVGGGMINPSASVEIAGSHYFVKWNSNPLPLLFEVEVRGLTLLREANAFCVPEVIAHGEASPDAPAYLILEWIDAAPEVDQRAYAANFGQALATLHRITAPTFGLDHDNFIGSLIQRNTLTVSWAQFFRDQRITVQIDIARALGYLLPYREALLRRLLDRIESILGASNPPSLIHGDLWSGNYFAAHMNQPVLFDPAVYYGDREIEIAYAELFGASAFFLEAYQKRYPLDLGYEERRPLLQLYPMLVHLNHFGERYGEYVDAICRHYLT